MDSSIDERNQAIRDKWFPIFHLCTASIFLAFYLIFKLENSSESERIWELLGQNRFILRIIQAFGAIAAVSGVIVSNYMIRNSSDGTFWGRALFAFDIQNYRLKYYKPYLYLIGLIVTLELLVRAIL